MKKFGYFVRLGGDREIAEALSRGATGQLLPAAQASSEAVRRVAMWQHTPEEWRRMTRQARRKYGKNAPITGVPRALLIGYAMICLGVRAACDWVCALVEGGGRP